MDTTIIITGYTGDRSKKIIELRDTLSMLLTEAQIIINKIDNESGVCLGRVSDKEVEVLTVLGFKIKRI